MNAGWCRKKTGGQLFKGDFLMKNVETLISSGVLLLAFCLLIVLSIGRPSLLKDEGNNKDTSFLQEAFSDAFENQESLPNEQSEVLQDEVSEISADEVSIAQSKVESERDVSPKASVPSSTPAAAKPVSEPEPALAQNRIVDYTKPSTYDRVQSQISGLCSAYPGLLSSSVIGTSVQGRNITLLKLGTGSRKICLVGAMHAREHITTTYLMRCAEDYAAACFSDNGKLDGYDMKYILNNCTFYIVPNCNPDGTEILLSGQSPSVDVVWNKKSAYKANANGVNLNRNFPFLHGFYDKMSTVPHEGTFPGYSAASEPETVALMELCASNTFEMLLSFHIQGECIYWSDSFNVDTADSSYLAGKLSREFGFYKCPTSSDLSLYGGGFENWFRYNYGREGFCIELMPLGYSVSPLSDYDNRHMESSVRYSLTRDIPLSAFGR